MNEIKINNLGQYELTTETGSKVLCDTWYEKKTDAWHVRLPKDNETGRRYVRKLIVDEAIERYGKYEFETKTTGPRVLGSSSWESYMTEEEKVKYNEAKSVIESIKEACLTRKNTPLTEEEKIDREIARLLAKKEALLQK